jgi:lycopene cyclase domain-containing protein
MNAEPGLDFLFLPHQLVEPERLISKGTAAERLIAVGTTPDRLIAKGTAPTAWIVEEWLFFVVVPWATFFIYEVLQLFFPWTQSKQRAFVVVEMIAAASATLALVYHDRWYTLTAAGGLALGSTWLLWKRPWWTAAFLRSWGVGLIPFFIVNGVLTGMFLPEPIVWYNNAENMGLRLGTIPVEDALYGTFMMLMYTAGVHWSRQRFPKRPE